MPPLHTRWYPRRVKYYAMAAPEHEEKFSASSGQAVGFLKTCFFNLERARFERFLGLYEKKAGKDAAQHARAQYPDWKRGRARIPAKTLKRVLECVPPCLSRQQQFTLLTFQISSVLHLQKAALKTPDIYTSELGETYRVAAARIRSCEFPVEWYLKDLFSMEDGQEFKEVFTYTMLDRLYQSYTRVRRDLALVFGFLPDLDCGMDLRYRIHLLGCSVKLDDYGASGWEGQEALTPPEEPALVTAFRGQYEKILFEHELAQRREAMTGQASRTMALHDVENVVAQLKRISTREYETTLNLTGSGGTITLKLQKKNVGRMRIAMAFQALTLVLILGGVTALGIAAARDAFWAPVASAAGLVAVSAIWTILHKFRSIRTEATEYERKRTRWLAAFRH